MCFVGEKEKLEVWLRDADRWIPKKGPYEPLRVIGEENISLRGSSIWLPPRETRPDWLQNLTTLGAQGSKRYVPAVLEQMLPGNGRFYERLGLINEYFMEGQLKNFMVCLLALQMIPVMQKKIRILYVGSRAGEGSGRWLEEFAIILLHRFDQAEVLCYDPAEKNEQQIFSSETSKVTLMRYGQRYQSDGKEVDLVIDDIFEPVKGTSKIRWQSKYWCAKVHESGDFNYITNSCFHKIEARAFSHPIVRAIRRWTSCICPVCTLVDTFAKSEDEYVFLRAQVHSIYRSFYCPDYPQYHDLGLMSTMKHKLTIGDVRLIQTNAERRVVDCLSEKHPITYINESQVRIHEKFVPKKRNHVVIPYPKAVNGFYGVDEIYEHFSNKKIKFFSVSPSILGKTPIQTTPGGFGVEVDIAFVGRLDNVSMSLSAKEVWAHKTCNLVGFELTDQVFKDFRCWVKKKDVSYYPTLPIEEPVINQISFSKFKIPTEDRDKMLRRMKKKEEVDQQFPSYFESPLLDTDFHREADMDVKVKPGYQTFPLIEYGSDAQMNVVRYNREMRYGTHQDVKNNFMKKVLSLSESQSIEENTTEYVFSGKDKVIEELKVLRQLKKPSEKIEGRKKYILTKSSKPLSNPHPVSKRLMKKMKKELEDEAIDFSELAKEVEEDYFTYKQEDKNYAYSILVDAEGEVPVSDVTSLYFSSPFSVGII